MKLHERLNFLLLGTLWILAIVLILNFWLNTAYRFNMFSGAHWAFISNIQAQNMPISNGFYIAFIIAITMAILGLYLLFRPKFRKIKLPTPQKTVVQQVQNTQQNVTQPEPAIQPVQPESQPTPQPSTTQISSNPIIARPPRLHIQMPQKTVNRPVTATSNTQPTIKKTEPVARYTDEIREIFETNKFMVLTPKSVNHIPLSLIAIGANETLWIGANDISHEQMSDIMLALKNIFSETLEDIEIDLNAFIINPTDTDFVEAILDVKDIQELKSAIQNIPNEPESDEDNSMDAFAGYIETVLTYLGNK